MFSSSFKRKRMATLGGVVMVLLCMWHLLSPLPILSELARDVNYTLYDLQMRYFLAEHPQTHDIVLVDVDEKSLKEQGRWPWSRQKMIQLIKALRASGVAVIAFDIVFAEPERNNALMVQEALVARKIQDENFENKLREIAPSIDGDSAFADELSKGDIVLGYLLHHDAAHSHGALPDPMLRLEEDLPVRRLPGYTGNLPLLNESAGGAGFMTVIRDEDDVVRRIPLMLRYGDYIYTSLAFEAAKRYVFGEETSLQIFDEKGVKHLEGMMLDQAFLATDQQGQVLVPYLGKARTFPYISATDILSGHFDQDLIKDALVFVGTSALGLEDLRHTPVGRGFPGMEINANVTAAVIDGHFPAAPQWAHGVVLLICFLAGLIFAFWMPYMSMYGILVSAFLGSAAALGGAAWAWTHAHFWLPMGMPLLLLNSMAVFNFMHGYLRARRRQHVITDMFGHYVPEAHVQMMSESMQEFSLEGDNREMTVLFSDIRSFTSIAESLSAKELKLMLNTFFTPITEIIFNHDGTIDKYVGDMVMAFWGAPIRDECHAQKAIEAALQIMKKRDELKLEFRENGLPEVDIGIGINTGWLNVGDMGSSFRRSYTVIGDAVNLASRIESSTKYYGVDLLVGENTREGQEHFLFRRVDKVRVKGKSEAVKLYEPVCYLSEATQEKRQEVEDFHTVLDHYSEQQWELAREGLLELSNARPSVKLYHLYLERIDTLQTNPPGPDWDGALERREK